MAFLARPPFATVKVHELPEQTVGWAASCSTAAPKLVLTVKVASLVLQPFVKTSMDLLESYETLFAFA